MKQFTFWNANKTSPEAHEHVTLRFVGNTHGTVLKLTRDKERSVRRTWEEVGTWDGKTVWFTSVSRDLTVGATHLWRNGWAVHGVTCYARYETVGRKTNKITCPETLMGRERKRSLDLGRASKAETGATKFGKRFKCDVAAMRAAILARKGN